jgi:hypothetical protein
MDRWKAAPGRDIREVHSTPVNLLTFDGHWILIVVINDLDIPSLVVTPDKTDAPLGVGELALSRVLFRLHIRDRPY